MKRRQTFLLMATSCFVALTGCSEPSAEDAWVSAGEMTQARSNHSATALSDGSVLIAGGENNATPLASAEVWNAATRRWVLAKNMQEPRVHHTGVRVSDGRILLLGGVNETALSSVEAYDPATRAFSSLAAMKDARSHFAALRVKSLDLVLAMGGKGGPDSNTALGTVEAYDPATNAWSYKTNLSVARAEHTATLLDVPLKNESNTQPVIQAYVVVIGGVDETSAVTPTIEVYNATNGSWRELKAVMAEPRHNHTATQFRALQGVDFDGDAGTKPELPDGSILVVGGQGQMGEALASVERYDCARTTTEDIDCIWNPNARAVLHHPRYGHTATLLNSGHILVVGGQDDNGPIDSVELYDVKNDTFVEMKPISSARTDHSATWLSDGSVLVVGGRSSTEQALAERFVSGDARIPCAQTSDCPESLVCNAEQWCEQASWPLDSQSACTYAVGEVPAGTGAFFAVLLGAYVWRRKRISKHLATGVVAGALLLIPRLSPAQSATFYLDRLQIAGGSQDGNAVWRPVFGRTGLFGQLAFGYADNPLRIANFVFDPTRASVLQGPAVNLQMTAYATAGFEVAKRGAVQVTLPYVVLQKGYATDNRQGGLEQPVNLASSAVGDLRIDGRMLLAASDTETFALAFRGAMFLPTGNEFSFAGERSAWGNVGLSAEYNTEAFFVTANAGLTVRPRSVLVDLVVGTEFVYAVGAYVPLRADRVRVGAELWGGLGLSSLAPEAIPVEAALTSRLALGAQRQVFLGVSAGGRLGAGYAPDVRFVARIGGNLPFERASIEPRVPERVVPEDDTDADGFLDADDNCPLIKEDFKREKDGCPETDEDRDGIDTSVDACPEVPEDKDNLDDTDGCPEEDADGDGFADGEDKCPKEPGVRNNDPAKLGCPQFIERTNTEVKLVKQIEFEFQSATISASSFPILEEIAKLLSTNQDIKQLRIEGHTDNVGDPKFNQGLSVRRAGAVRDYLVQRGKVKASRLSFVGFGQTKPIAPNDTDAGRAKNRRVELHIGAVNGGEEKPDDK